MYVGSLIEIFRGMEGLGKNLLTVGGWVTVRAPSTELEV